MSLSRVSGTWLEVGRSKLSGSMLVVTSLTDPSSCIGALNTGASSVVVGADTGMSFVVAGADTGVSFVVAGAEACTWFSLSDSSMAFLKSWAYRFSSFFGLSFFDDAGTSFVVGGAFALEEDAESSVVVPELERATNQAKSVRLELGSRAQSSGAKILAKSVRPDLGSRLRPRRRR